jgi:hypothetical protein
MTVMTAASLKVSRKQREALEQMARSTSLPHRCVVQASALLLAADGEANEAIARACSTTSDTVRRWRRKFEEGGVDAVGSIAPGRGRNPEIPQEVIDAIVDDTLHTVPDDESTAWSTRTMAERHGVGKDTVARIWKARNLRPWRVDTFKLSNDPRFEEKLIDVVGTSTWTRRSGSGVQLRREDPLPGTGSDPAVVAAQDGSWSNDDP